MFHSRRDSVVRTLCVFFIIWATLGPIDLDLIEFKSIFLEPNVLNSAAVLWSVKIVVVLASLVLFVRPWYVWLICAQALTGGVLLYLGVVSNTLWNYNTHILIISFLVSITSMRPQKAKADDDLVMALSFVFATIYYQAALSKLIVSGSDWMNSGLSIYVHMTKFNPMLAEILDGRPILYQIAGWSTVVGEFVLGTLFVIPKTRKLAALISISFHVMLWIVFKISFWHLWIFYPALYATSPQIRGTLFHPRYFTGPLLLRRLRPPL